MKIMVYISITQHQVLAGCPDWWEVWLALEEETTDEHFHDLDTM